MPQAPAVPHRALAERGTAGYAAPKGVEGMLRSKKPAPITPAYFRVRKTCLACKKAASAVFMRLGRLRDA